MSSDYSTEFVWIGYVRHEYNRNYYNKRCNPNFERHYSACNNYFLTACFTNYNISDSEGQKVYSHQYKQLKKHEVNSTI